MVYWIPCKNLPKQNIQHFQAIRGEEKKKAFYYMKNVYKYFFRNTEYDFNGYFKYRAKNRLVNYLWFSYIVQTKHSGVGVRLSLIRTKQQKKLVLNMTKYHHYLHMKSKKLWIMMLVLNGFFLKMGIKPHHWPKTIQLILVSFSVSNVLANNQPNHFSSHCRKQEARYIQKHLENHLWWNSFDLKEIQFVPQKVKSRILK